MVASSHRDLPPAVGDAEPPCPSLPPLPTRPSSGSSPPPPPPSSLDAPLLRQCGSPQQGHQLGSPSLQQRDQRLLLGGGLLPPQAQAHGTITEGWVGRGGGAIISARQGACRQRREMGDNHHTGYIRRVKNLHPPGHCQPLPLLPQRPCPPPHIPGHCQPPPSPAAAPLPPPPSPHTWPLSAAPAPAAAPRCVPALPLLRCARRRQRPPVHCALPRLAWPAVVCGGA